MSFVPAEEIDPLQMDAAYYLAANGATAAKPYTLLREALKRSRKVAIAKYALRGRERLGMLRVVDDVIAMHGLLWPDEIRAPEGVAPEADVTVRDAELDLADALMATLGEVEMASLHDDYREAVEALIVAKSGGAFEPTEAVVEPAGGQVIDLMAALEKSVRAAKASRGEADGGGEGDGEGDGEAKAEVTPIRRKARAGAGAGAGAGTGAAAPKAVGGKKSTAASAKKTAASAATKKKTTTTAAGGKSAAGKSTSRTAKTAAKSTAKTAAAKKTGTAAAAKKTATPRKRTSA